jgi:hypothetical protein
MEFIPFPSIGQFKDIQMYAKRLTGPLQFRGTVKLHGTNAGIVGIFRDGKLIQIYCQSRNRIVTPESDNVGFAKFIQSIPIEELSKILFEFDELINDQFTGKVVIFGEFSGGNIQPHVALNQLPKMFVSFSILVLPKVSGTEEFFDENLDDEDLYCKKRVDPEILTGKNWSISEKYNVYNVFMCNVYNVTIDFNCSELSQNELVSIALQIEEECPFAKHFGISGIGEGVVFTCVQFPTSKLFFKVKGEKHSVSKVKTLKQLAPVDVQKANNITDFVVTNVTQNRLQQGLDYLAEMNLPITSKSTFEFIKWVIGDVLKESGDSLKASNLIESDVKSKISEKARIFFTLQF